MTVDEILAALEKVAFDVPTEALAAAEEQQAALTPKLLEVVERTVNDPQWLLDDQEYQFHIYALYLLARFREKAAYPHFVKLFNLADEMTLDLTGDVLCEDGPVILASVFDGDIGPIKTIIENEQAHALLRTSAIASLPLLYMWGERTREEVIAYFRSLFAGGLSKPGDTTVWAGFITCCGHMQAQELADEVAGVVNEGLVMSNMLPLEEIQGALIGMRPQMVERFVRRYRPIESTAESISWWRCFTMNKEQEEQPKPTENPYANANVGRNDPCPCGSRQKFKKCHGSV